MYIAARVSEPLSGRRFPKATRLCFRGHKGSSGTVLNMEDSKSKIAFWTPFLRAAKLRRFEQFFGLDPTDYAKEAKNSCAARGMWAARSSKPLVCWTSRDCSRS